MFPLRIGIFKSYIHSTQHFLPNIKHNEALYDPAITDVLSCRVNEKKQISY